MEQLLSLDPSKVIVLEDRQRKDLGDLTELRLSIAELGQLQPIIVRRSAPDETTAQWILIAGERRLRCCIALEIQVKALDFGSLSLIAQQLIELEENVKRKDLSWEEKAAAICKIHQLHVSEAAREDKEWTQVQTAQSLGISAASVNNYLKVGAALEENPALAKASGYSAAVNLLRRGEERRLNDALEELLHSPEEKKATSDEPLDPVTCGSFLDFAESYTGPRFNLLHCDFPYGVEMGTNALQDTRQDFERYDDSESLYWSLVSALIRNAERLLADEAHIVFWYSMNYHEATRNALSQIGKVNPFPLIWHKSDNTGLLPDPQRGPRRIYETAFLVSRGDRKIVRPVSNCVSLPANKDAAEHLSEKPVNVLLHYFPMLVDETTRLLDPTAGSGTSLVAAKKLGAKHVQGIELNQGFCDIANRKFWRET